MYYVQDHSVFIATLVAWLCVQVGILLRCQGSEWSCICVLGVSEFVPFSTF
jgi:hypothetical protein